MALMTADLCKCHVKSQTSRQFTLCPEKRCHYIFGSNFAKC